MKKGFTLLELVVVIIIIGILATLAITQYGRVTERSRGAEARAILGFIRKQALSYYLEWGDLTNFTAAKAGIGNASDQIPSACRSSHYFRYSITTTASNITTTATRCTAGGKPPQGPANATLTLTTVFPAGEDTWGGTGGY
jgi:type IV pilus assembly protein PilE